jgi:hypothetical protein
MQVNSCICQRGSSPDGVTDGGGRADYTVELGGRKADRATKELGAIEVEAATGELNVIEGDCATGNWA